MSPAIQMQLESIEPAHGALPLGSPSLHGLVLLLPLDVAWYQRSGVDDGYARALAKSASLEKEQQVKPHLSLTLHEAVVWNGMREVLPHVLADIAKVEWFQVAEMVRMEQQQYGHYLAVGHAARTVAMALARDLWSVFFQLWSKIFAEFFFLLNNTSSRIQKISIKFAVVMGMGICS